MRPRLILLLASPFLLAAGWVIIASAMWSYGTHQSFSPLAWWWATQWFGRNWFVTFWLIIGAAAPTIFCMLGLMAVLKRWSWGSSRVDAQWSLRK